MRSKRIRRAIRWTLTCIAALGLAAGAAVAQDQPASDPHLGFLALIPLAILAKSAIQAVIAALFPHWSEKALTAVDERRGLATLWGLALAVLTFVVLLISGKLADTGAIGGLLAIPGIIFCLAVALLANWGFVGPAIWMGERLLPNSSDRRPLQAVLGALVLALACLLPVIGWALMLLLLFASLGSGLIATFTKGPVPSSDEA